MNTTTWKYTAQSVIGTSHTKMGTPCQDAHRIEVIQGLLVGVVADGAGSAKHAELGAQLVTGEAIAQIRTWSSVGETEDEWQKHIQELIEFLREKLNTKATEDGCALKDFAATFLLAIVTEKIMAGAQIGDGAIVYGLQGEEPVRLLIEPERGEYLNETVFLTSDNYHEHLKIAYDDDGIVDRVALLSDGLQMLALDMKTTPPVPHQPFFRPFFESLANVPDDAEREHGLSEFLQSPRVCSRTDDDKTFVFARRLPELSPD